MATQSEVLQAVNRNGFYSACLYQFNRDREGLCIRGIRDVSPAEKLVKKGILTLKESSQEISEHYIVTHFTWVKS